jgi:hypothetical protein
MRRDEGGYIVIETIGTFIPFLFLILSILALVNIVTLQARVHYALTQTAETLSMYSYAAEVTGVADVVSKLDSKAAQAQKKADDFKANIDGVMTGIQTFSFGDVGKNGEAALNTINGVIDDPKGTLQLILDYGADRVLDKLVQELIRPLFGRYLLNGELNGADYIKGVEAPADASLKSSGVSNGISGFDFEKTNILGENGTIRIVVQYDVDYLFNALPLRFTKLKITQIVETKAWLNGSGEGYAP